MCKELGYGMHTVKVTPTSGSQVGQTVSLMFTITNSSLTTPVSNPVSVPVPIPVSLPVAAPAPVPLAYCSKSGINFFPCSDLTLGATVTIVVTAYLEQSGLGTVLGTQSTTIQIIQTIPPVAPIAPTPAPISHSFSSAWLFIA
jgi:hypothetical protein